jgi:hypothetical protein
MYHFLDTVTLKSGERVEAAVITGPDETWADRLETLLGHKGPIWAWQNQQVLRHQLGIDVHYHILHRGGVPFANILTCESHGVGILGHVWTQPQDRQQHASTSLMRLQMEHFRNRGGKALFLGTTFDSPAHHLYSGFGFRSILPQSGLMYYFTTSPQDFSQHWFAPGPTRIEPLNWSHWPLSEPLFLLCDGGYIRLTCRRLFGPRSTEEALLQLLHADSINPTPGKVMVLRQSDSAALLGLATWDWHPLWPGVCLVDIFCHPDYWDHAPPLLRSLQLPQFDRCIAYTDDASSPRSNVLRQAGFLPTADIFHAWRDPFNGRSLTLSICEKQN